MNRNLKSPLATPPRSHDEGAARDGSQHGGPNGEPACLPPVPRPRRLVRTGALLALVVAMYVLHQDFWNWQRIEPLVFGFLPIGLAYHAAYSILAAGMMAVLVRFAWPRHLEKVEPHTASADQLETEAKP